MTDINRRLDRHKSTQSSQRFSHKYLALSALTFALSVAFGGTLLAQTRTAQRRSTPPPNAITPPNAREGATAALPQFLSPEQLTAIRANGERSQLLLKFPFDIAWGLP